MVKSDGTISTTTSCGVQSIATRCITAREMWQQHDPLLENYFWGDGFWEESHYIGTAGEVSSQTIEQYIERTEHV